tara:strand:+ start:237 stop:359 length:123 start_codon:yes stop_codon:yes gene_type:complete
LIKGIDLMVNKLMVQNVIFGLAGLNIQFALAGRGAATGSA